MTTRDEFDEKVRGWFTGRLPEGWFAGEGSTGSTGSKGSKGTAVEVVIDREEITVVLTIDDVGAGQSEAEQSEVEQSEARAGRASAFREETRDARIKIAREAEHRYGRKVSWGVKIGDHGELWTHVAAPVMTRLRQPQRLVLDTLVEAGVARSRSEALAWCVRLVGQHEEEWLGELRDAMAGVADVRGKGPAA